MNLIDNILYQQDLSVVCNSKLPWKKLKNSSILITGASGLVGSCLIDVIQKLNKDIDLNCKTIAIGRNENKAKERFNYCWNQPYFQFVSHDVNKPFTQNIQNIKYVIHMASNTHPIAYANDPIGTITANIIGTYNMLNFAVENNAERFAFASSNEIYGENRGDTELFDEDYCGYINSNTMRAGYPESKRCGESLCQAFAKQKNLDIVIPRLTRSYGPTMLMSDTKAISQFIKKGIAKENIVLKSKGEQFYSYTYVMDAVSGLLTVLLLGESLQAYNVADVSGDITLKDLAQIIADYSATKVVFELPDKVEESGYSKATKARLDGTKLQKLGWKPYYSIKKGIHQTLKILTTEY